MSTPKSKYLLPSLVGYAVCYFLWFLLVLQIARHVFNVYTFSLTTYTFEFLGGILLTILFNKFIIHQKIFVSLSLSKTQITIFMLLSILTIINIFNSSFNSVSQYVTSLGAALNEELMARGILFAGFLSYFSIHKLKKLSSVSLSILISSAIFSCMHLLNIQHQGINGTLQQMIQTLGMGVMFSCIYLATKNILWPMFIHGFIDLNIGLLTGLPGTTHGSGTGSIMASCIILGLYSIIGLTILTLSQLKRTKNQTV